MAFQPGDLIVVNRNGIDYKAEISAVVGDGNINLEAGDGLEATGDNATANQFTDTTRTFTVKTASGIIIDGGGNVIIDPNFNLGTEEHGIGDGAIEFNAGDGLAETGNNATANQIGDTSKTFSVKTGGGIIIDGGGNVIIDPDFNLGTEEHGVGDGAIEFNAGTGLSQTGSNASANQNNDTAKTFNVNTADGITIDGSNNVIIDPTFNIGTDEHGVHDGKINIDAGLGLAATGSNATANQKSDTNRVLSAKTADGITIDSNGNIIIDPNFNLDGNITPPGDGKITIKDFEGTELGSFTVNQDGPTDISLPAIDFPDSLHPKGFINVEDPAPTGPEHGDIYIQHKTDGTDATSDASFDPAIAPGTTVPEGSLVIFGVDDKWHFGGNVGNTQVQSDWAVTDASDVAFIKNKPDLQAEVDLYAGDGAINVNAGPGLSASGSNATANQKSGTTRTLQAKVADGIIINGSGEIIIDPSFNLDGNVTAPGNGQINVNGSDGITASGPNATANQGGNTTRTLKVDTTWLGSWIDTNKPAPNVGDGQITIKDADGNSVGAFTVNQASDQDITLPEAGDVKWDDIQNKPCVLECGISCTVEYTFLGNIDPEDYFNRPPIQQYSLNTPNDRDKSKSITGNSWQWYAYQITEEQQFVLFGKPDEEKFAWGNDLEYSDDYDYSATFELDDGTKVHVIQFYNAGPYSAFQTITAIDSDLCGGTSGIGDGKINIRTSKGVSIGSFTVNQDFDQDIFLDSFPEAPDDGNVYVRDGTNEQWVRGIPYNYSVLDELV